MTDRPRASTSGAMRVLNIGVVGLVLLSLTGCSQTDEQKAPVEALVAFVTAIERSAHEPEYREQAFAWLDSGSQRVLNERASLARSLAGRELEGWEMLVPGRLNVTARDLRREGLRASIDDAQASIELAKGQRVELVREAAGWRIRLWDEAPEAPGVNR